MLFYPTTLVLLFINKSSSLDWSPFARRYWGNRFYFLFLQVLRCFNSLGLLKFTYRFSEFTSVRFPYSEIAGSPLTSNSPAHFAGSHVLHRFWEPRDPSQAIKIIKFFSRQKPKRKNVEVSGLEPLTGAVQKQRSTNWAIPPHLPFFLT